MLPANLAKTRTAGRGTYGEFVVYSGAGPSNAATAASALSSATGGVTGGIGPGPSNAASATIAAHGAAAASLRYAPYPLPATITNQHAAAAAAAAAATTTHILPLSAAAGSPSLLQYANSQTLLDLTYKRLIAANAAAASMRHHPQVVHNQQRATLSYPIGELLAASQGFDLSALYPLQAAALGL